jgi:type II secretory pathway pseudopilin PulG
VPIPVVLPPGSALFLQPVRVDLMKNVNGFSVFEVMLVLSVLSMLVTLMVSLLGTGSTNQQAENSAMKLMNDFASIEMAFNNYKQEKATVPAGLTDATFVPTYLFPPKADTFFVNYTSTTAGAVDGYRLGAAVVAPIGNYICAQAPFSTPVINTVTSLLQKVSSQKVFVNSVCPSATTAIPASGTVSITYWIVRN